MILKFYILLLSFRSRFGGLYAYAFKNYYWFSNDDYLLPNSILKDNCID